MTDKLHCPECGVHIDEHEAGRCLDAWVAESVMGWEKMPTPYHAGDDWSPSRRIAAALEAVKKMEKEGYAWSAFYRRCLYINDKWEWGYWFNVRRMAGVISDRLVHSATGITLPLAISRTLIKACADD